MKIFKSKKCRKHDLRRKCRRAKARKCRVKLFVKLGTGVSVVYSLYKLTSFVREKLSALIKCPFKKKADK